MKRGKLPFGMCSTALLALALTACAGSVDGEKAAKASVLNVVIGTGVTWSAPRVLVTRATKLDDSVGTTNPTYLAVARAGGSHPSAVSADTSYGAPSDALSMTVDGVAMGVHFNPVSIADQAYDLTEAEKDGLEGLAHSMLSAGRDTQDYARFGLWESANGDDLVQLNEAPAATYGGRGTPGAAVLTVDSATSIGMTARIEVENTGEFGVISGDIAVTANFASASMDSAINGEITNNRVDRHPADARASLNGSPVHNTFNDSMNLTDRAGRQAVESGPFAGRFIATGAQERASGWNDAGDDGTKALGVKHEAQPGLRLQDDRKAALSF